MNAWIFTLVVILSQENGFQNHFQVSAFPVGCNRTELTLDDLCPNQNTSGVEIECLSNDIKKPCPQARVFGVSFNSTLALSDPSGNSCTHYHLITKTLLDEISSKLCYPLNSTLLQVAFESESAFNKDCSLSIQQYNLSTCDSLQDSLKLHQFPYCVQYPCSSKLRYSLIRDLSLQNLFGDGDGKSHSEEEFQELKGPLSLESKSKPTTTEIVRPRSQDRPEFIHRVRKPPTPWNWRDHVLQITISLICSAIILVVGLKICLAERFMDAYQNARIISTNKQEHERHRRLSDLLSTSEPYKKQPPDCNTPPSKPILKNGSHHKKYKSQPSLSRIREESSEAEIRSFESQSSIYYDAMEGPDQNSHFQPLLT